MRENRIFLTNFSLLRSKFDLIDHEVSGRSSNYDKNCVLGDVSIELTQPFGV